MKTANHSEFEEDNNSGRKRKVEKKLKSLLGVSVSLNPWEELMLADKLSCTERRKKGDKTVSIEEWEKYRKVVD